MSNGRFILDGHLPVAEPDLLKWAKWFGEKGVRRVASTQIGHVWVSTVFLGLDHRFGNGAPLLFETMTFVKGSMGDSEICERCSTWEQAVAQHERVCAKVRERKPE